jgi:F-type H+-transporting ATPase subunit b
VWYEQEAAREMWSTRTLQRNVSSQYYHRLLQSQNKEAVQGEMKQLTAHNEELIRQAKQERDEIIYAAKLRAEKGAEEILAKASSEANAILAKARQDIENEKKRAIVDLRNEIANLSIDIAERLIESELSDRNKADAIIKKELQDAHLN